MCKSSLLQKHGVQVTPPSFPPPCPRQKIKVANMEGREWGILNSNLAAYLADFASRKLANPNESRFEKLGAFKLVCGFEWSRRAITKVSPHKLSALVQRAARYEATKELAKKLRSTLHKIWSPRPARVVGTACHHWN